jgi:hypothetical protein
MTKEIRQCPSCGGFCKKSGCERANTAPPAAQPAQEPWVGLTDEEREAVANITIRLHGSEQAYATAIEAKLKEKNFD